MHKHFYEHFYTVHAVRVYIVHIQIIFKFNDAFCLYVILLQIILARYADAVLQYGACGTRASQFEDRKSVV